MKRDRRLRGLSSDHHHALVLVRAIRQAVEAGSPTVVTDEVRERYERSLAPHFATEEEILLPALRRVGEDPLARRTADEHAALRRLVVSAVEGDLDALRAFGSLLEAHVRFEERELFPICEDRLDDRVLEAVAERTPRRR